MPPVDEADCGKSCLSQEAFPKEELLMPSAEADMPQEENPLKSLDIQDIQEEEIAAQLRNDEGGSAERDDSDMNVVEGDAHIVLSIGADNIECEEPSNSEAPLSPKGDHVIAKPEREGRMQSVTVDEDSIPKKSLNFYNGIKAQLLNVFRIYAREDFLADAIPDSEWARITGESNYIIGIIKGADRECKYICYAIDGREEKKPEGSFRDISEWYPKDAHGNGYWLVYQDADTGEVLRNL